MRKTLSALFITSAALTASTSALAESGMGVVTQVGPKNFEVLFEIPGVFSRSLNLTDNGNEVDFHEEGMKHEDAYIVSASAVNEGHKVLIHVDSKITDFKLKKNDLGEMVVDQEFVSEATNDIALDVNGGKYKLNLAKGFELNLTAQTK